MSNKCKYYRTHRYAHIGSEGKAMDILVKRAVKGDEEAFMKLIDNYMLQMYKVARTRLKDEDSIGDAIQETILAAFKNVKKLKYTKYFNTWLIKILINKCNDQIKNNKIEYVEDYNTVYSENLIHVDKLEDSLDFEKALSILNQNYKIVIVLYYVNRFTIKEISEILNENESTIKSRLKRAREKLKDYYLKEEIV